MSNDPEMRLPNGQWVKATPIPFYEDMRPWYVRLYHVILILCGEDDEELMEGWYRACGPEEDFTKMRG